MMIAAVELAMPALAALFLVEVVLGIASRFAPQANVFLIGLPAKVVAALASVGAVVLLMPETMDGVLGIVRDTFRDAVAGLGG
jgi:flagellar biosynthetic protein FliR